MTTLHNRNASASAAVKDPTTRLLACARRIARFTREGIAAMCADLRVADSHRSSPDRAPVPRRRLSSVLRSSVFALFVVLLFPRIAQAVESQTSSAAPNVILIFADDLGYGDPGCFNSDCPFRTPRLDQMAAEGARLTSFYVPTPYCAPSRGTILTGRYPFRHSVVHNPAPDAGLTNFGLPSSELTIAELLKPAGYATAAFGKWHLGHLPQWLPTTQGFDHYLGILYSNDMFPVQLVQNEQVVEYPVPQSTLTHRYTEQALEFIRDNRDRPFFLYLPHAMPHKPLAASDDFYTPESPEDLYADVMAELDFSVGQILDELKKLNLDERTLVIFTSDNGPWYGGSTGGLRGMKGRTWEGGLRVPLIARMPGTIPAGIVNHHPAATIDVLPTVCALAGVAVPDDRIIDGRSVLSMLQDSDAASPHEAIFGMQGTSLATIRSGRWKLHVRSPGHPRFFNLTDEEARNWVDPRGPDGVAILAPYEQARPSQYPGVSTGTDPQPMMLFDLETDRAEQTNVADQNPEVVERLLKQFRTMEAEVPQFETPSSAYLFRADKPRQLMRLIGGELRYDRVPQSQKHLLESDQ
ncbi:MAG: sulfatase [Planctomycetaceae bacterium]|nr:sulfatase [Planctomycetaceae bacterium]